MMFCYKDPGSNAPAIVMDDVFDKQMLNNMIKEIQEKVPPQKAEHMSEGELTSQKDTRNSTVRWFMDAGFESILRQSIDVANYVAGWRYDIVKPEMLQFTEYNIDGHYNWHTDGQGDHHSTRNWSIDEKPKNLRSTKDPFLLGTVRKISVSVILNDDYEGGNLEFMELGEYGKIITTSVKPKIGTCIIFPSFVNHRVSPVTKGTRYSVVAWYGGPPFK